MVTLQALIYWRKWLLAPLPSPFARTGAGGPIAFAPPFPVSRETGVLQSLD